MLGKRLKGTLLGGCFSIFAITQAPTRAVAGPENALAKTAGKAPINESKGFEVQVAWLGNQGEEVLPATGQGGCYNEAYRLLPREESLELCSELSSLETVLCFKSAIETLPKQYALQLCRGQGSRSSIACFGAASRQLPPEAAIGLCSLGGDRSSVDCFSEAAKTLSTQQALRLCAGGRGGQDRLACYSQATLRFGVEFALEACDLY